MISYPRRLWGSFQVEVFWWLRRVKFRGWELVRHSRWIIAGFLAALFGITAIDSPPASTSFSDRWFDTFFYWQIAAAGIAAGFVYFVRFAWALFAKSEKYRPKLSVGKSTWTPFFHGVIERLLFTVVSITIFRLDNNGDIDGTAIAGLLIAATIYLTLREKTEDTKLARLSVYSLWNFSVSVGLGLMGGWVYWRGLVL